MAWSLASLQQVKVCFSSHVMPMWAGAMAGIYDCGIQESAHLNMKTRHCISGWGRVKQPCHADVGLCDGGHLWLRHTGIRPSQYETRHCISGCGRVVPLGLWLDALSSSASRRRQWVVRDGVLPQVSSERKEVKAEALFTIDFEFEAYNKPFFLFLRQ